MKRNIRKQLIWNYCISSVTLLVLLLPSFGNSQDYDLIIRGGKVVDGSGNPWYHADIAIKNDRIAEIGQLSNHEAKRVIDAHGLVVAPGFIDPHTHALRGIFEVPTLRVHSFKESRPSPKATMVPHLTLSTDTMLT